MCAAGGWRGECVTQDGGFRERRGGCELQQRVQKKTAKLVEYDRLELLTGVNVLVLGSFVCLVGVI